jgi:serine/threonine-protein kinase RsbW
MAVMPFSAKLRLRVDISTGEVQTTAFAAYPLWLDEIVWQGRGVRWLSQVAPIHKPFAMTEHRVSYTLDSTLETVDSAEQAAGKVATEAGFDEDEVMRISMAVREAAVNAVLHGNAYDPGKKVSLVLERTSADLVITIRDQGKGLDMSKIPDPLAPENLLKTSGRGIFLIRSFMDEVQIHPSQTGTEIKLIKHVHGTSEGGKEASQ